MCFLKLQYVEISGPPYILLFKCNVWQKYIVKKKETAHNRGKAFTSTLKKLSLEQVSSRTSGAV